MLNAGAVRCVQPHASSSSGSKSILGRCPFTCSPGGGVVPTLLTPCSFSSRKGWDPGLVRIVSKHMAIVIGSEMACDPDEPTQALPGVDTLTLGEKSYVFCVLSWMR